MVQQNTEFAIYVTTVLIFLAAAILILVRPLTWGRWLVGLVAGAVWLITWYTPVPIWIGIVLILLTLWGWRQALNQPGIVGK
jgi:hypothetical protein